MKSILPPGARRARRRGAVSPWLAVFIAAFVVSAWALPATASALYRCTGAGGETAYVSNTTGYSHCTKMWESHAAARRAEGKREAPVAAAKPAQVLSGPPPREVKANPAILKVVPLGDDAPVTVKTLAKPQVLRPLPLALLDTLGAQVLPRVLGVPPAPPPAPPPHAAVPAPAGTAAIPLKLNADVVKPPRTGAVYRVVQKNGTVLYTNVASLAQGHESKMLFTYIIECYACDVHSKIDWNTVPLHLVAFDGDIRAAARSTGVDVALLRAIIHAESGFNPAALSYKGAQGLMQLMPGTASDLGVGDAFDPAQNISGGARYLAMLLHDFHGDVKLAAAAYNAGAGAVTKYGGVPPYAETEVYVKRVALLYERYRKALAGNAAPAVAKAAG